jgi:hypothetical protein
MSRNSSNLPPRNSSPTTVGASASAGSRKSPRTNSSNSPSGSATNSNGRKQLHTQFRSVLHHRLGLPLVCAFHGRDPGKLEYLRQQSHYFSSSAFARILREAVARWKTEDNQNEAKLTKFLSEHINANIEIPLHAKGEVELVDSKKNMRGRVDIALYRRNSDGPAGRASMIVEVGLNGADWWKKFDQGVRYVKMMFDTNIEPTDKQPLLLAIMTIDRDRPNKTPKQDFVVKLGVFLCSGKNADIRISLLWNSRTRNLQDGSNAFGRLLRGVCDFSSWQLHENDQHYEYFGSNCCQVRDKKASSQLHSLFLSLPLVHMG